MHDDMGAAATSVKCEARSVKCGGRAVARVLLVLVALAGGAACSDTLPDQDLRIVEAVAVAKLPTDDLWREYQEDVGAADDRYWGQPLEVSGVVVRVEREPTDRFILFGPADPFGVRANLLDESAADLLETAEEGERLRLKCFCGGLDGHVILTSCVPAP